MCVLFLPCVLICSTVTDGSIEQALGVYKVVERRPADLSLIWCIHFCGRVCGQGLLVVWSADVGGRPTVNVVASTTRVKFASDCSAIPPPSAIAGPASQTPMQLPELTAK